MLQSRQEVSSIITPKSSDSELTVPFSAVVKASCPFVVVVD